MITNTIKTDCFNFIEQNVLIVFKYQFFSNLKNEIAIFGKKKYVWKLVIEEFTIGISIEKYAEKWLVKVKSKRCE